MVQDECSTQQRRDLGIVNLRMSLGSPEVTDLVLIGLAPRFWHRRWRLR